MKSWTSEIIINAPIEKVWAFMDGSEENLKLMDPHIIEDKSIEEVEGYIGTRHLQKYKEGKQVMEYEVLTKDYLDTPNKKILHIYFELGNYFKINAIHTFIKIDDNTTKVIYETTNEPISFFAKLMMLMPGTGSKKILEKHLNHLKDIIENDKFNYKENKK